MSSSDFDVSNSPGSGGVVPTDIPIPDLPETPVGALQLSLVFLDKFLFSKLIQL